MSRRQTSTIGLETRFFLIGAAALALALMMHVVAARAQSSSFVDVPAGAYYEEAADALLLDGALEQATYLRPGNLATRAEMMKMLVLLNDEDLTYPTTSSFADVPKSAWYSTYIETAAKVGWVKGDKDCYQRLIPCYARPSSNLNRAEAATLLARAFNLEPLALAPRFSDVSVGDWYDQTIQAAADRCILQGDAGTSGRVRPGAYMNRAEMITMFHRAQQNLRYGEDCGPSQASLTGVSVANDTHLRLAFAVDLSEARAESIVRYTLQRVSDNSEIEVQSAVLLSDRTVELGLSSALRSNTLYVLYVDQLSTTTGAFFSDSRTFTSPTTVASAQMIDVLVRSHSQLEVVFNEDLQEERAEETARYQLSRTMSGMSLSVSTAVWLDARHVQLNLSGSLLGTASYQLSVNDLRTSAGSTFDDTFIFSAPSTEAAQISSVVPLSGSRIRVTFTLDVDRVRLAEAARYTLTSSGANVVVGSVSNITDRSADLYLNTSLRSQAPYRLAVNNLLTKDGLSFADDASFVYDLENTSLRGDLNGTQEVPLTASLGTGTASYTLQSDGLRYDITVQNLSSSITDAHFHLGAPGVSGSALFPITFNNNSASGVWTNLTNDQRNAILAGNVYVNVHTITYPNGEIRGQVLSNQ